MVKNLFRLTLSVGMLLGITWTSLPPKVLAEDSVGNAVTFSCSDSESAIAAKGGPSVSSGNAAIYVGYRQLGQNKDPIIVKFVDGVQDWCRTDYETTGDDNTGYGLFWDGSDGGLYGVFSATGNQGSSSEDFRRFATNGWLRSYADASMGGGGPKVAIVARIDPDTGDVTSASYVTARKPSDDKINSIGVQGLSLEAGYLRVSADSWYSPRNPDKSIMQCDGSSPFDYTLWFKPDLSSVVYATATNCVSNVASPVQDVTLAPAVGFVGENRFRATVSPSDARRPITFTWTLNDVLVRQQVVDGVSDVYTHSWSTLTLSQTLRVTATNGLNGLLAVPPTADSVTFNVVEAERLYLPLVLRGS